MGVRLKFNFFITGENTFMSIYDNGLDFAVQVWCQPQLPVRILTVLEEQQFYH